MRIVVFKEVIIIAYIKIEMFSNNMSIKVVICYNASIAKWNYLLNTSGCEVLAFYLGGLI